MSAENDLALAYHMGYDDALAKRKPDASKAQVLAPYDLATENAKLLKEFDKMDKWHSAELVAAMEDNTKLRQLASDLLKGFECGWPSDVCDDCERDAEGMPIHGCPLRNRARELGVPEV